MIYLGSDHAGFYLKQFIASKLKEKQVVFEDLGVHTDKATDYPLIAKDMTDMVIKNNGFGILFCATGIGMSIAANRRNNIRAALCWQSEIAELAREHNNANIICLPAKFMTEDDAWRTVVAFLSTGFSEEERHKRRIELIDEK